MKYPQSENPGEQENASSRPGSVVTVERDIWETPPLCVALAIALGAVYIGLVTIDPTVVHAIWGSPSVLASAGELSARGARLVLALCATRGMALLCTIVLVAMTRRRALGLALTGRSAGALIATGLGALVLAVFLNRSGVWPFAWRWQYQSTTLFVRSLWSGGHSAALMLWIGLYALGVPLIEEIVFRFGVLRLTTYVTRSALFGVILSAVAFGAVHLGYPFWRPDLAHLWNAIGASGLGLLLGTITIKDRGRIGMAVAIHCGVNVAASVGLLVAARTVG